MSEENSCSTSTTSQATLFTTTSTTSSHRQRIERQITCTSEVKTSSELKSFSEIHNLHFDNASKFRKASIENILDGKETITTNGASGGNGVYSNGVYCRNISVTGEPLITYPESPVPSSLNASMANFPCEIVSVAGSRKSSNASVIDDLHGFERRLSSASKTKLLTEQFIGGELVANAATESNDSSWQNSQAKTSPISERSLDTKNVRIELRIVKRVVRTVRIKSHFFFLQEQRKLSSENVTHQSSTIKLQADSFSAEEKVSKNGFQF